MGNEWQVVQTSKSKGKSRPNQNGVGRKGDTGNAVTGESADTALTRLDADWNKQGIEKQANGVSQR